MKEGRRENLYAMQVRGMEEDGGWEAAPIR